MFYRIEIGFEFNFYNLMVLKIESAAAQCIKIITLNNVYLLKLFLMIAV